MFRTSLEYDVSRDWTPYKIKPHNRSEEVRKTVAKHRRIRIRTLELQMCNCVAKRPEYTGFFSEGHFFISIDVFVTEQRGESNEKGLFGLYSNRVSELFVEVSKFYRCAFLEMREFIFKSAFEYPTVLFRNGFHLKIVN